MHEGMGAVQPAFHDDKVIVKALRVPGKLRLPKLEFNVVDTCFNKDRVNAVRGKFHKNCVHKVPEGVNAFHIGMFGDDGKERLEDTPFIHPHDILAEP